MKKQKKNRHPIFQPFRSMTAIGWRLGIFAFAVWLAACTLITDSVATEIYNRMQLEVRHFVDQYAFSGMKNGGEEDQLPGYAEYCCIDNMVSPFAFTQTDSTSPVASQLPGHSSDRRKQGFLYDFAVTYQIGDVTLDTNRSYLTFPYMTAEQWKTAQSVEEKSGFAYIDLSKLDANYRTKEDSSFYYFIRNTYGHDFDAGRFTGYFEGNEFIPISVDYCTNDDSTVLEVERRFGLYWYNIYQAPTPEDRELVTIYAFNNFGPSVFWTHWTEMGAVTVKGRTYETLEDVLFHFTDEKNVMDAVVTDYATKTRANGETIFVQVALRSRPLPYAIKLLAKFYAGSLLFMALGVWLILRKINKHLARPVAQVAYCSTGEPQPLPEHIKKSKWLEGRTLQENYEVMVKEYHSAKAEVRQLRTALDYAQNAETKRREMISNITHELKTPLAVIHSYAEGLKDGIAADKQEQYLTVIQEEADRMDTMVLEMLDLSRLEAGKVRLAQDRFSLLGLTCSVFDRLAPMAEEKELQIQYYIVEEFDITADESRIGQVITNFATNAIKYTPAGGTVWIKVYRYREQTVLSIENQCEPLPEEALTKVWDSFYRTETSRTTKGTGLGLTIAKAIIELHGGTVSVANTQTGVEFKFSLP